MAEYIRIMCLGVQPNDNDNRIYLSWIGPDDVLREYSVRQNILNNYDTEEELKAAVDLFTSYNFGYTLDDVFFHLNRDGTWAIATGEEPDMWAEDYPSPPEP